MSSDNGIYLLQTLDGFRVIHAQGIDNIFWWPTCCANPKISEVLDIEGDMFYHERCTNCETLDPEWKQRAEINPDIIYEYFKGSLVFSTKENAMEEADRLYLTICKDDFCGQIEYGIQFINGLEHLPFPTKREDEE